MHTLGKIFNFVLWLICMAVLLVGYSLAVATIGGLLIYTNGSISFIMGALVAFVCGIVATLAYVYLVDVE